ncbi:hypothetical protein KC325_g279 [Hortaea werneckii]|nr:hypothetical protein KC325_g279 [Hortaea werneckii]
MNASQTQGGRMSYQQAPYYLLMISAEAGFLFPSFECETPKAISRSRAAACEWRLRSSGADPTRTISAAMTSVPAGGCTAALAFGDWREKSERGLCAILKRSRFLHDSQRCCSLTSSPVSQRAYRRVDSRDVEDSGDLLDAFTLLAYEIGSHTVENQFRGGQSASAYRSPPHRGREAVHEHLSHLHRDLGKCQRSQYSEHRCRLTFPSSTAHSSKPPMDDDCSRNMPSK